MSSLPDGPVCLLSPRSGTDLLLKFGTIHAGEKSWIGVTDQVLIGGRREIGVTDQVLIGGWREIGVTDQVLIGGRSEIGVMSLVGQAESGYVFHYKAVLLFVCCVPDHSSIHISCRTVAFQLMQGFPTPGPRAKIGPRDNILWPARPLVVKSFQLFFYLIRGEYVQ